MVISKTCVVVEVRRTGVSVTKRIQINDVQRVLRTVTCFLTGVVTGVAAFAFWADRAGALVAGPLLNLLLPIGLCVGMIVASLPALIGEILSIFQSKNAGSCDVRTASRQRQAEQRHESKMPT